MKQNEDSKLQRVNNHGILKKYFTKTNYFSVMDFHPRLGSRDYNGQTFTEKVMFKTYLMGS